MCLFLNKGSQVKLRIVIVHTPWAIWDAPITVSVSLMLSSLRPEASWGKKCQFRNKCCQFLNEREKENFGVDVGQTPRTLRGEGSTVWTGAVFLNSRFNAYVSIFRCSSLLLVWSAVYRREASVVQQCNFYHTIWFWGRRIDWWCLFLCILSLFGSTVILRLIANFSSPIFGLKTSSEANFMVTGVFGVKNTCALI